MKKEKINKDWIRQWKNSYVPNCGDDEVCQEFYNSQINFISNLLKQEKEKIAEEIEKMIENGWTIEDLIKIAQKLKE